MAKRLWNAIQDYWVAIGIFVGIAFSIYDLLAKFTSWGLITANWVLTTGVFLFFISGVFAIIKYRKKERDLEVKKAEAEKIEVKSKYLMRDQNIAADTVNIYERDGNRRGNAVALSDYDEISKLMNKAIVNTERLTHSFEGEKKFKKRHDIAFQSGNAFHNYYNDHRHYFSVGARELLDKLDELLLITIQDTWRASIMGNEGLWVAVTLKYSRESKTLREEIINEFQKGLLQ